MTRLLASLLAALLIAGCASVEPAAPVVGGDAFAGRLSVRVEPTGSAPARSLAAAFDLRGSRFGRHRSAFPPRSAACWPQARWQPGSVVLVTPQGSRRFADLDALTREVLGESVPIEAWFDWLHGRPWPGAASTPQAAGDRLRPARLDGRPLPLRRRRRLGHAARAAAAGRGADPARRLVSDGRDEPAGPLRRAGAGQAEPVPARRRPARRRLPPDRFADAADRLVRHPALRAPRATPASPGTTSAIRSRPTTSACAPPGPCSRRPERRSAPTSRSRSACPRAPGWAAAAPTPPRPCWRSTASGAWIGRSTRLLPIGLALGADLPFFLDGRPARVGGIGERLTPVALRAGLVRRRQAGRRPGDSPGVRLPAGGRSRRGC